MVKGAVSKVDILNTTGPGFVTSSLVNPLKHFGLQVVGSATSWIVHLEGSLDNEHWDEILIHDSSKSSTGKIVWSGSNAKPSLYIRVNVVALTLGPASNIKINWLGMA